jgi:hypothetical protein
MLSKLGDDKNSIIGRKRKMYEFYLNPIIQVKTNSELSHANVPFLPVAEIIDLLQELKTA